MYVEGVGIADLMMYWFLHQPRVSPRIHSRNSKGEHNMGVNVREAPTVSGHTAPHIPSSRTTTCGSSSYICMLDWARRDDSTRVTHRNPEVWLRLCQINVCLLSD